MATFTSLDADALLQILEQIFLSPVVDELQQISDGIENSNYLVSVTAKGLKGRIISGLPELQSPQWSAGPIQIIVTIVEMLDRSQLEPIVAQMVRMADCNLQVPGMFTSPHGESIFSHADKPLMLVPLLEGRALQAEDVQAAHCRQVGCFLGALHQLTPAVNMQRLVDRDYRWILETLQRCEGWADPVHSATLVQMQNRLSAVVDELEALPVCWTHGDLFIDNALFRDDDQTAVAFDRPGKQLSGIIDFYRSGLDTAALDLAIAANDWCWDGARLDPERVAALVAGYESQRSLTAAEQRLWPELLAFAAARFYTARMLSQHTASYQRLAADANPSAAAVLKDPAAMLARMITALAMR